MTESYSEHCPTWLAHGSHKYFHFFFLLGGRPDVNSNHVSEDQPEAEVGISQENSTPGDSAEGEKEAGHDAGLASAQDAPTGPQLSEE